MANWSAITILVFGLSGCGEQSEPRIFPGASELGALRIRFNDTDGGRTADVNDSTRIADFVGTLKSLDREWNYTWHTYPTPQAQVALVARDGAQLCVVDLGPNWVGSDCGHTERGWPPLTSTSPEVGARLRDAVGGKWALR